jgi:short-subunit dehydrogenase
VGDHPIRTANRLAAERPGGNDQGVRLDGAVALVTGASGEIGAACARIVAARGGAVLVSGRDADRLAAVAADTGAMALSFDLEQPGAPRALAAAAEEVHGRIDVLLDCAGLGWRGPAAAMSAAQVDQLVDVNLRSPLQLATALLPGMLDRRHGHLGFVASVAGWTGVREEAVYSATKAGLITFAESVRAEYGGAGIGVSVVSPGAVATEFFTRRGAAYHRRFPRPLAVEKVAAAIVRGVERDRAHQMLPRWLAVAPLVRTTAPPLFRTLQSRFD